jgi:hypothetical protein
MLSLGAVFLVRLGLGEAPAEFTGLVPLTFDLGAVLSPLVLGLELPLGLGPETLTGSATGCGATSAGLVSIATFGISLTFGASINVGAMFSLLGDLKIGSNFLGSSWTTFGISAVFEV